MATIRTLQPTLRNAVQRTTLRSIQQNRFLNSATAPSLYAVTAHVTGGRAAGKIQAENLNVELGMPKALGGAGGKTNPEELFAAGYGACFQGAMNAVAPSLKIKLPEDFAVEATTHLVGDASKLDLGIRVDMKVKAKGVSKEDLQKVVDKTKEVCPYSRATKGNVETNVEVVVQ